MISMIGIDHNSAPVDIRALFSFTKKNAGEAMLRVREQEGVLGCVILSTCNRMELWVSTVENWDYDLYDLLCGLKDVVDANDYRKYFVVRTEEEAVSHLFYLSSGLKSQILGEDQILTQVKDALSLSRENYAADNVLEVLFRMAVTAGKKIKTEVVLSRGNPSVIHQAIRMLKNNGISVREKRCMVIGNGEMGKMAAQTLRESGADVTVTVRQYRSGEVQIPSGCKRINYGERMGYVPECDLIVSATASPNYTLRKELFENMTLKKDLILIDLAVPRDVDPELAKRDEITLYDMDSFRDLEKPKELEAGLSQADQLVQEQMAEFFNWYSGRNLFQRIDGIKSESVNDLNLRIHKIIHALPLEEDKQKELLANIDTAAEKVVNKMIYGLRSALEPQNFTMFVDGLEKVYPPKKKKVIIGSRESALAVRQSEMVRDYIQKQNHSLDVELLTMKTTGDKILDRTLDQIGGKGLFVKELDRALLSGRSHLSVHSLKDLPMEVPEQLPILAFSKREDPRDVLILPEGVTELDPSKPIGSSSLRRVLQLKRLFPDMELKSVRGNLQTRLRKLDSGEYSALVLAAAGVKRLHLEHRISRYFEVDEILPAAGQGILAVQGREGEDYSYLSGYGDEEGTCAALAERAFVRVLDGGCSSPVAAHAVFEGNTMILEGMYYQESTGEYFKEKIIGDKKECEALGVNLAKRMKEAYEVKQQ